MNLKQKEKFAALLKDNGVKPTGVLKIMALLDVALVKEPKAPKVKKTSLAMTLMQWEEKQGKRLDPRHMLEWIERNKYDIAVMVQLVEEFRIDMLSKGKEYADFRMAFQNYFNKGYLSIKPDSPRVKRVDTGTSFDRRGFSL